MSATTIEWADYTFNPWWGCTEVSPACDHCYARTWAKRTGFQIWGQDAPRRFFGEKHWNEPLKWNAQTERDGVRKRVFCGSMCDVMEEYNGSEHLVKETIAESRGWLYNRISRTSWLDWLLLTKRPHNYQRFLPAGWLELPMPNVWLMTTVESEEFFWRIEALKSVPAVVHGLSVEPLLGPMTDLHKHLGDIEFVIVGGESGPGARPMNPEWARSIRDQCQAAGVAFFFKQWGDWEPWSPMSQAKGIVGHVVYPDILTGQPGRANGYPMVRIRGGKKAAGRLLDGVEWSQFPEVRR